MKRIPLLDLTRMHAKLGGRFADAFRQCVTENSFILGPKLEHFEKAFADYCGVRFAIGVDNGASALELSLRALGVGAGDEVITTTYTFYATAQAIATTGAKPVLVDVDEANALIDPALVEKAVTPRTKAILPVHLYGACADMERLQSIARKHGLFIVEDACQAHGALYKDRRAGSLGHAGCFSFYPTKNLGGLGDGGAVTTDDAALADRIRTLRHCGRSSVYSHDVFGYNKRLDTIQAVCLGIKLPHLEGWNRQRRKAAALYDAALRGLPVTILRYPRERPSVYHLYVIRTERRDALQAHLQKNGISTAVHYPKALHLQKAFDFLGYRHGQFPVSERLSEELLSLPMFPGISASEVGAVAKSIREFFAK